MIIDAIGHNNSIRTQDSSQKVARNDMVFEDVLQSMKELLYTTQRAEDETTQLTYDFMTGKNDNIHNLLISQEKSSILLQFTMQVRNKVIEAYQEIMRMSV